MDLKVIAGGAPTTDQHAELGMSQMLATERSKIIGMLNDLADLKFFAKGAQRRRLEQIEQALRLALLENHLHLQHGEGLSFSQ